VLVVYVGIVGTFYLCKEIKEVTEVFNTFANV